MQRNIDAVLKLKDIINAELNLKNKNCLYILLIFSFDIC